MANVDGSQSGPTPPRGQARWKWLTLVALPVLIASTLMGYYAVWGVLFIFWGALSIASGDAFLIEPIERGRNPVLFWAIVVMWIGFGLLYIWYDIAYRLPAGALTASY